MSMTATASVEVLTAAVRVLMVGSRQVTLSVFRQLDWVDWKACEPFGRVNDGGGRVIVGRRLIDGSLVRAQFSSLWEGCPYWTSEDTRQLNAAKRTIEAVDTQWPPSAAQLSDARKSLEELEDIQRQLPTWQAQYRADLAMFEALPLIVLAGLK